MPQFDRTVPRVAALAVLVSAPCAAQTIQFSDQTAAAGLTATHGGTTDLVDLNHTSGGAGVGDFDRDGDLDLVLALGDEPHRFYDNNGDGTFTDRTAAVGISGSGGYAVAVGDYDDDGWLDVFITLDGTTAQLYRNLGGGAFVDVAASAGVQDTGAVVSQSFGAAFGDLDGDGDLDLFVSVRQDNSLEPHPPSRLYENQGDGTFVDITESSGPRAETTLQTAQASGARLIQNTLLNFLR